MGKRTATKSSKASKPRVVKRSRSVSVRDAKPEDVEKYMKGYSAWRRSFENSTRHRAYIKSICQRIVEQFSLEKIILFGSHAYGRPGPDCDLDLLVVMHFEGGYLHQASEIRRRLGLPIPMDLLVLAPQQVQKRLEIGDRFMREIIERGKVIYEADHCSGGLTRRKRTGLSGWRSYRAEKQATQGIQLPDKDGDLEPVPTTGGEYKPKPEMDRQSNILRTFNDLFGNIQWKDEDRLRKLITEEIQAKVSEDKAYQNAKKNSDRQAARIEHDRAIQRVLVSLMKDDKELFKQFSDNQSFRRFLTDTVFALTYEAIGGRDANP